MDAEASKQLENLQRECNAWAKNANNHAAESRRRGEEIAWLREQLDLAMTCGLEIAEESRGYQSTLALYKWRYEDTKDEIEELNHEIDELEQKIADMQPCGP